MFIEQVPARKEFFHLEHSFVFVLFCFVLFLSTFNLSFVDDI
jgi:hypothetical protein